MDQSDENQPKAESETPTSCSCIRIVWSAVSKDDIKAGGRSQFDASAAKRRSLVKRADSVR